MIGAGSFQAALARRQAHAAVARFGTQLFALFAADVDILHQRLDALLPPGGVFLGRLLVFLNGRE